MKRNTSRFYGKSDVIETLRNESGETRALMEMLSEHYPTVSRTGIKSRLKYGYVRLGGRVTTRFDAPVAPGEKVEVNRAKPFEVFRHRRMELIYEDADILVVNKGYGLLSVGTGSARKETTAYDILKDYLKRCDLRNKLFIVHRLDRNTSGLMMFAKSVEAKEAMQHNWNNMVLSRDYIAVVEGVMEEDSGVVRSNLAETRGMEVYSTHEPGMGKPATTRYKVLSRGQGRTLVKFSLDTGRKNQIRVHAADLGHPICGDRKYGGSPSPAGRMMLHAATLRFVHPMTRRDMNFSTPMPPEFGRLGK